MKSDIILEDQNIKVVSNHADFDINNLVIKGNKTEIIGKVELTGGFFFIKDKDEKEWIKIDKSVMTVGNSEEDRPAVITVHDKRGHSTIRSTVISSPHISGQKMRTKKLNVNEIEVGPTAEDSPKESKIIVNNKHGDVVITIDGEKEDIFLKSIGSLTDKIKELERKISTLEGYHPRVIRRPIEPLSPLDRSDL